MAIRTLAPTAEKLMAIPDKIQVITKQIWSYQLTQVRGPLLRELHAGAELEVGEVDDHGAQG